MNVNIHKTLIVIAAYGIVQVLAQDLGIKTGKRQRDLIQSEPFAFILLFAGAYSVTEDLTLSLITTTLYYFLKFIYSRGITSPVCFEEV
tara:strand:+ start:986 stop:1252 length:267 start_codon:yes stop_codon:yes gene_type:complete